MKNLNKIKSKIDTHYRPKIELTPLRNEIINLSINKSKSNHGKGSAKSFLERPQTRKQHGFKVPQSFMAKAPSYSNLKLKSLSKNKRVQMFNFPDKIIDIDKI